MRKLILLAIILFAVPPLCRAESETITDEVTLNTGDDPSATESSSTTLTMGYTGTGGEAWTPGPVLKIPTFGGLVFEGDDGVLNQWWLVAIDTNSDVLIGDPGIGRNTLRWSGLTLYHRDLNILGTSSITINGNTICTSSGCTPSGYVGAQGVFGIINSTQCMVTSVFTTYSTSYVTSNLTCQFQLYKATDTVEIDAEGSLENGGGGYSNAYATIARDGINLAPPGTPDFCVNSGSRMYCRPGWSDRPGDTAVHTYSIMIHTLNPAYNAQFDLLQRMSLKEIPSGQ